MSRMPVSLTKLDVSSTQVTGDGIWHLSRLTQLRELSLASISNVSAAHVKVLFLTVSYMQKAHSFSIRNVINAKKLIPRYVEKLDISYCKGSLATRELLLNDCSNKCFNIEWPPGLKELRLRGLRLSLACLIRMNFFFVYFNCKFQIQVWLEFR